MPQKSQRIAVSDLHFSALASEDLFPPKGRAGSAPKPAIGDPPELNLENTVRGLFVGDTRTVGVTTKIERIDTEGEKEFCESILNYKLC